MCIQPKYDRVEETPLAFFKFVRVTLVIGFVLDLINMIPLLTAETNWYSIVYCLVSLVLRILAIWGLGDMKWIGIQAYYGSFILVILDSIAAIVLCVYYGEFEPMGTAFGRVLGAILVLVPVWIYFGKRRLLFEPAPKIGRPQEPIRPDPCVLQGSRNEDQIAEREKAKESPDVVIEPRQIGITPVRFCRNCGCELVPDSKFCRVCGTKVVKEW